MAITGNLGYLLATLSFVLGMIQMNNPGTAKRGNFVMILGMFLAILSTLLLSTNLELDSYWQNWLLIAGLLLLGVALGRKISFAFEITRMPELVSLFNGFGGLSAAFISLASIIVAFDSVSIGIKILLLGSLYLGVMTFSASILAFLKLGGKFGISFSKNQAFTGITLIFSIILIVQAIFTESYSEFIVYIALLFIFSLFNGIFFANGVGGADMPVLISVLNGLTGIITTISGVYFENTIMILLGVFVGFTGVILTIQMSRAMNTSLGRVFFSKRKKQSSTSGAVSYTNIQETTAAKIATELAFTRRVVIVPGFGLAVAQAQKLCFELKEHLSELDIELKFVIHPVAGRMPGHMNVLLAEANISYDDILDLEKGNEYLSESDYCFIIGANDVVNIAAELDENSPIFGMPIIQTYKAKKVVVIKRSLANGYAGISNPLFDLDRCYLLLADAKIGLAQIISELKST